MRRILSSRASGCAEEAGLLVSPDCLAGCDSAETSGISGTSTRRGRVWRAADMDFALPRCRMRLLSQSSAQLSAAV
jgi:hypothetical protein